MPLVQGAGQGALLGAGTAGLLKLGGGAIKGLTKGTKGLSTVGKNLADDVYGVSTKSLRSQKILGNVKGADLKVSNVNNILDELKLPRNTSTQASESIASAKTVIGSQIDDVLNKSNITFKKKEIVDSILNNQQIKNIAGLENSNAWKTVLNNIASLPDNIPAGQLNALRRDIIDSGINFARNTQSPEPLLERALLQTRDILDSRIKTVGGLGKLQNQYNSLATIEPFANTASATSQTIKAPIVGINIPTQGFQQQLSSRFAQALQLPQRGVNRLQGLQIPNTRIAQGTRLLPASIAGGYATPRGLNIEQPFNEMQAVQQGLEQPALRQQSFTQQPAQQKQLTQQEALAGAVQIATELSSVTGKRPSLSEIMGIANDLLERSQATATKPLTVADQSRVDTVQSGLSSLEDISNLSSQFNLFQTSLPLPNLLKTPEGRQAELAITNLSDVIGRLRSGAAVTADEEARFRRLLPAFGDDQTTINNKLNLLRQNLENVARRGLSGQLSPSITPIIQ